MSCGDAEVHHPGPASGQRLRFPSCWACHCWRLAAESLLHQGQPASYGWSGLRCKDPAPCLALGCLWKATPPPELPPGSAEASLVPKEQFSSSLSSVLLPSHPRTALFPRAHFNKHHANTFWSQNLFLGVPDLWFLSSFTIFLSSILFFFNFLILLKYSWFTLCQFLLYSKVI